MRKFKLLSVLLVLLFTTLPSFAGEKFALVVGGRSRMGLSIHETARVTSSAALGLTARRDYQVTYLLGDGPSGSERRRFSAEFKYIDQMLGAYKPATDANLESALKNLTSKAKAGDQVELFINAHGSCRDAPGPNCDYTIWLSDENGGPVKYPADRIMGFLNELDARGVKTTFIFEACYSGSRDLQVRKLKNTCTFLLSAADAEGTGCNSDLPLENAFYSSTVEYVALRYYKNVLPLLDQGYYRSSSCYQRMRASVAQNMSRETFSTVNESFWAGFACDKTVGRPVLNDFTSDQLAVANFYSRRDANGVLNADIQKAILALPFANLKNLQADYAAEIERYRGLLQKKQQAASMFGGGGDLATDPRAAPLLRQIGVSVARVMGLERQIIAANRNSRLRADDPCNRPL